MHKYIQRLLKAHRILSRFSFSVPFPIHIPELTILPKAELLENAFTPINIKVSLWQYNIDVMYIYIYIYTNYNKRRKTTDNIRVFIMSSLLRCIRSSADDAIRIFSTFIAFENSIYINILYIPS